MPSSEQRPPRAITTPVRRTRAATAVAAILSPILVYSGVVGIRTGYWHFGAALALFGLLIGAAVVLPLRKQRALGTAPVHTDDGVLRIGFSRVAMAQGPATVAVGAVGGALLATAAFDAGGWGLFWAVVFGALSGYCLVELVRSLSGGLSVGELRLGPTGVRLRVDALDVIVPWDDLVGLSVAEPRSDGMITGDELCLTVRNPPRPREPRLSVATVAVPINRVDLDHAVLHHLLRFYWEHPQARGELAGPAAVARLRDRAFPD